MQVISNKFILEIRKYGPISKHLFQRAQRHGGWKSPWSNDKRL